MDIATYRCPKGDDLELLAGTRRADDDGSDDTGSPREPAWCPVCDAYFWVVQSGPLVYVRNATPDTQTLNRMAGLLIDRGRAAQARQLLARSIHRSVQDGDFAGRAMGLCQLSRLYALEGDTEDARIVLGDALGTLKAIGDPTEQAALLHEMAGLMAASGEVEEALRLYQASLDMREGHGDALGAAATLHEIAALRVGRGQVEEALWLCRQALDIRQQHGDQRGRAATLRLLGGIHATRGQIDRSLERFEESLDAFDKACDLHGRAAALGHMAELLADIGRITQATKLLREAMWLNRQIGNARGVARTLQRTASLMAGAGKLEGALRFLGKALAIYERIGSVQGQSATWYEMGYQLSLRGRVEEARGKLARALALAEQVGDTRGRALALIRLAQVTFATDPIEAFDLLRRGERQLARIGAGRDLLDALQTHRAVARATRNSMEFCAATANLVHVHLVRGDATRAAENAVWLAQKLPFERSDLVHHLASFALLLAGQAERKDDVLEMSRRIASELGLTLEELEELTPEVRELVGERGALGWVEVALGEWLLAAPQPFVTA